MLELLHIENIAVIESADISFRPGFNALSDMAAGMEIVEVSGCQLHALQIAFKDLAGKFPRPLVLGARVQRIRRMGHDAAQLPVLLHLHEHGGVRRVSTFCSTAARIARKKLKGVRADGTRGPPHRGIALRRGQMAAQIQHKRPPASVFFIVYHVFGKSAIPLAPGAKNLYNKYTTTDRRRGRWDGRRIRS